jgi:uncharacterized protein (TIGR02271 family)
MQHTLVAVFDNRSDAQKAMDDLLAGGFTRPDVRLSEGDPTAQGSSTVSSSGSELRDDESIGSSIKNFFSDIFGTDRSESARMYQEAVTRGHYVLTVSTETEPEVERAADIIERYGPVDIDEKSAEWGASAALRSGAGAQQQAQPMSQQSSIQGTVQGSTSAQGSMQRATTDTTAIPVVQEELKVGKREVQRGGVRVYSHVVETPVKEKVDLREEHVTVQRRAIDKMIDPAEVEAFKETEFEVRETAEEAVIEKSARVVEEVVVGKEVTQHEEEISDTLRRTEVEVEELGTVEDDNYFRGHWTSNYANAGGTYDEYAPAYRYGSSMRKSELYRGRPWEDVETDLRADWSKRNPGSAWEKFKAAIRHGWERMTT